jgi:hypothetical protein
MGRNLEKEFFEQFEDSSAKGPAFDAKSNLHGADDEQDELVELGELVLRFQDGDIDEKQLLRLEEWILADCRARDCYVQLAYLYAGLHILLNKKHNLTFLNFTLTV